MRWAVSIAVGAGAAKQELIRVTPRPGRVVGLLFGAVPGSPVSVQTVPGGDLLCSSLVPPAGVVIPVGPVDLDTGRSGVLLDHVAAPGAAYSLTLFLED